MEEPYEREADIFGWHTVGCRGWVGLSPRQDLNLRPLAPEASALSAELRGGIKKLTRWLPEKFTVCRMVCIRVSVGLW